MGSKKMNALCTEQDEMESISDYCNTAYVFCLTELVCIVKRLSMSTAYPQ